jgi:hypothetical protein
MVNFYHTTWCHTTENNILWHCIAVIPFLCFLLLHALKGKEHNYVLGNKVIRIHDAEHFDINKRFHHNMQKWSQNLLLVYDNYVNWLRQT